MTSESCPVCGEEADADVRDPHGHFTSGDDDSHGGSRTKLDEDDELRSLKQDDRYTLTYSFEYIAKNHGNGKYDIDTAEMIVHLEWSDAQIGYVISYNVPEMDKIDPGEGNSDAAGFYEHDVSEQLANELDSIGILGATII